MYSSFQTFVFFSQTNEGVHGVFLLEGSLRGNVVRTEHVAQSVCAVHVRNTDELAVDQRQLRTTIHRNLVKKSRKFSLSFGWNSA